MAHKRLNRSFLTKDLPKYCVLSTLLLTNYLNDSVTTYSPSDENAPQHVRVSISTAARLFGVNPRTIRRAISEKSINYIVVQNRYKLSFSSLVAWSQTTTALRRKRDQNGIGQWVDQWKIRNPLFSPRMPTETETQTKNTTD